MTEQEQLLAAIRDNPDDNTVRLAYADWLEGLDPVRVECGICRGAGRGGPTVFRLPNDEYQYQPDPPCYACDGSGTIIDTSNRDRAELIRMMCFEPPPALCWNLNRDTEHMVYPTCSGCDKTSTIRSMIDAHPEWSQCPHPLGDLLLSRTAYPDTDTIGFVRSAVGHIQVTGISPRSITWDRGFIDSVSCRMDEVGSEVVMGLSFVPPNPTQFVPTPWARAIVERYPVVRFVVTDKEPIQELDAPRWYWQSSYVVSYHQGTQLLPRCVFDALRQDQKTGYPTRKAALDALSQVVCQWVKNS